MSVSSSTRELDARSRAGRKNEVALVPMTIGACLGLAAGSFCGGSLQSIYPYVAGRLATSSDHALWTLTYFLIHWALGIALMPWFARKLGFKRLFLASMIMLAIGAGMGILSHSLMTMLVARGVQGISSGLLVPLVQTLLLRHFPKRHHTLATALWSNSMLVPFFFGPAFGGWLAVNYDWIDLFWLVIPFALLAFVLIRVSLPEDRPTAPPPPFDLVGLALLWLGLIALQIVLNQGEQFGWFGSPFIQRYTVAAILLLGCFIIWELTSEAPLLELRFVTNRNFGFGLLLLCLGWSIFVGWSSILPLWTEVDLGYNGWWGGVLLIPLALTAIPVASAMGRIARHVSLRMLAALCFLLFAIAFAMAVYNPEIGLAATVPSELLQGIAVGMLFVPLTMIILSEIPADDLAAASTTSNFIRLASDIVGVTMLQTLWQRHTESVAALTRSAMSESLVRQALAHARQDGMSHAQTMAMIAGRLQLDASTWSLDDALRLSAWICLGAAAVSLVVLKKPRPQGG
ncbi:DHA2 family efflux MFS transporter permease subunit [Acidiphilium multivorum]|jgi:DHA2 family multidrug resistance protein|uniref:Drug resistance transporter, EmrB/QacA subfamily n=2 Tax=Acidocellaceae TaxID=3385905 RepID=A5G048_ACICJ|nr:drug resistance transporter, EmrB/QacA subfamily [Acidiphilium cryptum JF-5]UNC13613.1 DHA2 family efflux MFS transporter permease subunit [Acidiphilium multivorum]